MTAERRAMLAAFRHFRRAWGPRAAYHLARVRHGAEWQARLVSAAWLAAAHIPHTGAAPSMNFPGLPSRFGTAGLAHAAADEMTARTGRPHVMAFRPRGGRPDCQPFTIEPADLKAAPAHKES